MVSSKKGKEIAQQTSQPHDDEENQEEDNRIQATRQEPRLKFKTSKPKTGKRKTSTSAFDHKRKSKYNDNINHAHDMKHNQTTSNNNSDVLFTSPLESKHASASSSKELEDKSRNIEQDDEAESDLEVTDPEYTAKYPFLISWKPVWDGRILIGHREIRSRTSSSITTSKKPKL